MSKGLEIAGQFLVEQLQKELREQGHEATGNLINSINYKIDGSTLIIQTPHDYVAAMENGLPKGHYVPISALIRWIEIKGIATGDKEVKNAAFAIRNAIVRDGSPTKATPTSKGAFHFSKNGRRTGFAQVVIDEHTKKVLGIIEREMGDEVKRVITNSIKRINKIK